jgi:hypothetical protein
VHGGRGFHGVGDSSLKASSVSRFGCHLQFLRGFRSVPCARAKSRIEGELVVRALDWLAAILCLGASAALVVLGAIRPQLVQNLRIPSIVFGSVGVRISASAIRRFTHPPADKMFWWCVHLQGMIGSYIAAWTAFSLVTLGPLLHDTWWLWLLPISI